MRRTTVVSTFALSLALATAGPAGAASAKYPVLVDDGKTTTYSVEVPVGKTIGLRFVECGPCGFHWEYTKKPAKTLVKRSSTTAADSDAGSVGGAGTHTFALSGLKAGTTTAKLGYIPPGAGASAERTVTLKVTVVK